jgi:SAM-dependent methyltransferase
VDSTVQGSSSIGKAWAAAATVETPSSSASSSKKAAFVTKAQAEYTNSITASRDTNVSPQEAYDSILHYIPPAGGTTATNSPEPKDPQSLFPSSAPPIKRALDVGAGAGLSTSYLYNQLGYEYIDGVDWSGDAWRANVVQCPTTVQFYEMDDDTFFTLPQPYDHPKKKYDIICYNFAINPSKAVQVAQHHLTDTGILFAPINEKPEYWYKQTYYTLNAQGQVLQKSTPDVGAWSIQFQPDVTSESCTGIWCGTTNGFLEQKKRKHY